MDGWMVNVHVPFSWALRHILLSPPWVKLGVGGEKHYHFIFKDRRREFRLVPLPCRPHLPRMRLKPRRQMEF